MKLLIAIFAWVTGLLFLLAIAVIAWFAFLFDPNSLRDDITRFVEAETGRRLVIEGELSMTYFPWLGFEVGRTTLSNPAGFDGALMATIGSASASVKLMPLLKRQIELSRVAFDSVDLKLGVLADGSDNWTDLIKSAGFANKNESGGDRSPQGVNSIHLGNAQISYTNAQSGDVYRISRLNVETGMLLPGMPFVLTASGDAVSELDEISGLVSITADAQLGNDIIYLRQADLEIELTGKAVPGDRLRLKMHSPLLEVQSVAIAMSTPQIAFSGSGTGVPWSAINGQASGRSITVALEEDSIAMLAPVIQLNGSSTQEQWATLEGKLNGQSLLLQIYEDKNVITIATPVMQMSSTSAESPVGKSVGKSVGKNWATLSGILNGPSMRLVSGKDSDTVSIDAPVIRLRATAKEKTWSELEASGKAEALELQVRTTGDELTMIKPNFQVASTGSVKSWSAVKGDIKGQSLKLMNYDLVDVSAMQVSGRLTGTELPGGVIDMSMTGERLQGSIDRENLSIDVARADVWDLSVFSKKIKASSIIEAPQIEALVQVGKFSPLRLIKNLGYEEIVTADKTAMSTASISGSAFYGPESMGLSNIVATVDQTAVTGAVKVMSTAGRETRFNIVVDTINLDRYRAPSASGAGTSGKASVASNTETLTKDLRALALDGVVKVGKMQLIGLHSDDVEFTIRAASGDIRINPARATLYGGSYSGNIHLDAKGSVPMLSLNERFEGVQFGPFSEDLLGRKRLTGTLSGRVTLAGKGITSHQIMASSNGDAEFKFVDGAYFGVDIWQKVRTARAAIKGEAQLVEPVGDRTRFGDLSGTATIVSGVLRSDNLEAATPRMKIRGIGNLDLATQKLDFKFIGDVYNRPELSTGDTALVGYPIPIKLTGTVAAPHVGVDMGGLLADLAKRKLLEKLGVGAGNSTVKSTDSNTPTVLEPTLADKVQGARQQVESKIKDRLKGVIGGSQDKPPVDTPPVDTTMEGGGEAR